MGTFDPKPRRLIEIDRELSRARKTRRAVLDELTRLDSEHAREVCGYRENLAELDGAIDDMLDLRTTTARLLDA